MKRTSLYNEHIKREAKMVDFAGWEMPVMYSSIIEEHNATRNAAALFDVSHMGEIIIKGKNAPSFLKLMIPTKLDKLIPYKSMYSTLCNKKGGVIDDLFIYMISDEEYFLVVNAGTVEKDFQWFKNNAIDNVDIINVSSEYSKIDLQGPHSKKILTKIISHDDLFNLKRFFFNYFTYNNEKIMISQSGYTGEFGYEIYIPNNQSVSLWEEILNAGMELGIKPAGLGARDTLRLEACYSLYGHELSEEITPVEAGLSWIISSTDSYIGKDVLINEKNNGAKRELISFEMDKGIPRENYKIFNDDDPVGYVTSGTFSPTLKKGIGLGLVQRNRVKIGDTIDVIIRDKKVKATVIQKPFYKYNEVI